MKNIINTLHKFASAYEKKGHTKEANYFHNLFLKFSNDENVDEDEDYEDDENPESYQIVHPASVFFNADTNQPIIHNGKYLIAISSIDEDLPEVRGKVRAMTGVENITLVRIPIDLRKAQLVESDYDIQRSDDMYAAHQAGIESIGDFVYLLLLNDNILNTKDIDIVFSSESDAYAYGELFQKYFESIGRQVEISVAAVAVSIADEREPGMSMPELFGDEEFIFVENSSFRIQDIPKTFRDLNIQLEVLAMSGRYTVERLQQEKLGNYDYFMDDEEGPDNGDRFSSTLKKLHKLASVLEDINLYEEANVLNDVFMRVAKKKAKKKKNVPNDPALYSRCKSEIKKKFKVYPSAYANMALVKLYKSRGGTYRTS